MTLPISHKIVVIDDNQEEIIPLLNALSKNGVGFIHFTGRLEQLPEQPLSGIRILFSDIDLFGAKDEKTKISTLLSVLKKIIAKSNGPYIIIFWTKHSDLTDRIEQRWNKIGVPPLKYFCLEKSECKDEHNNFSIPVIEQKIKEKTQSFQAFNFYLDWENMLTKTGENFIDKFHKLVPCNNDWSHNIYYFLYQMYLAVAGKKCDRHSKSEKFMIACQLFNKSFTNELDHGILTLSDNHQLTSDLRGGIHRDNVISAINYFLWIHEISTGIISIGDVFYVRNNKLKNNIVKKIIKDKDRNKKGIRLVKMVISPACDIAQNKLIGDGTSNLHRVVYAIITPCTIALNDATNNTPAWYYKFGPFLLKGENVCMNFHFGTVTSEYISDGEKHPVFTIKQEIVFDIQAKIANHMNRLGNTLLQ